MLPKSEGDGAKKVVVIDALPKGQQGSGKILVPFSFRFIIFHLRDKFHQGPIKSLDPAIILGMIRDNHNTVNKVTATVHIKGVGNYF